MDVQLINLSVEDVERDENLKKLFEEEIKTSR